MRFIGVLGVLALLGLAWAISYHRSRVKVRIVIWGLGLQSLFAVIILREDYWSFVGMGVLGGLVAVYLLRRDRVKPDRGWMGIVGIITGVAAFGGIVGGIGSRPAGIAALVVVVLLVINGRFRLVPRFQAPLGVLLVVLTVAWLVAANLYGEEIFDTFSKKVAYFLSLSDYGAQFLFGNLADTQYFFPGAASSWPVPP